MTKIKSLKNSSGEVFYPQTHMKAVVDENGNSIDKVVRQVDAKATQVQTEVTQAKQSINRIDENLVVVNDRVGDREEGRHGGMGYVVLDPKKSFAEQVTQANTIYEIRDKFDLGGASVTVPEGCTLKFSGGRLENGTLVLNYTSLEGQKGCFCNTFIEPKSVIDYGNVFINTEGYDYMFESSDDARVLQSLLVFPKIHLSRDYHVDNKSIRIVRDIIIDGHSHTITITKNDSDISADAYVFLTAPNPTTYPDCPKLNIEFKNLNVVSRSPIFGTGESQIAFGFRGVFLQALGHNVSMYNVDVDTTGTIITCWGYAESVKNRLGVLVVDSCNLKAAGFIVEDVFQIAEFYNSVLSINAEDKFRYECYVLSNMHDIIIDNCVLNGGIECRYRDSLGVSTIRITNSTLDSCAVVRGDSLASEVYVSNCIIKNNVSNVNHALGEKISLWGGIAKLIYKNNLQNISSSAQFATSMLLRESVDYVEITNNTFIRLDDKKYECEKILHCVVTPSVLIFKNNNIVCKGYKLPVLLEQAAEDALFDASGNNTISNVDGTSTRVRVNKVDRFDLMAKLFPNYNTRGNSRPQLSLINKGTQFYDATLNKPIWWTGTAWVDATGAEV